MVLFMNKKTVILVSVLAALLVILAVVLVRCNAGGNTPDDETVPKTHAAEETETTGETFIGPGYIMNGAVLEDEEETTISIEDTKSSNRDKGQTTPTETAKPTAPAGTVKPTAPSGIANPTTPAEATKPTTPAEMTKPTTPPEAANPTTPSDAAEPDKMTYEEYMARPPEAQQEFFESFASVEAYFDWFNAAKAAYEANRDCIEIDGSGSIDIGEIIGGNG